MVARNALLTNCTCLKLFTPDWLDVSIASVDYGRHNIFEGKFAAGALGGAQPSDSLFPGSHDPVIPFPGF
jgi:hypothetical protein